jgi:hypothetical protein
MNVFSGKQDLMGKIPEMEVIFCSSIMSCMPPNKDKTVIHTRDTIGTYLDLLCPAVFA